MTTAAFTIPALTSTRAVRPTSTFPFVALPGRAGSVGVEVCLVARLGHGAGNKLFHDVLARQRGHQRYVDELDEPSAKLGGTDFAKGDATALYSFGVGHRGHPFHRHAGHRVFTAVSGSGGAQLRFSTASLAELEQDPANFIRALRHVNIPPDCLFTVRFSGETWHQFAPRDASARHPAFFALSTHTNELGGALSQDLRARVLADRSDIPSLTELLPAPVLALLARSPVDASRVPTTDLALDDRPGGLREAACRHFRSALGRLRGAWAARRTRPAFVGQTRPAHVVEHHELPEGSLLRAELLDRKVHHQDFFSLTLPASEATTVVSGDAAALLASLLGGFLDNRPAGVSRLMELRNVLVKPLKLRTSPLGCPVSSLLSVGSGDVFAGRYPVRAWKLSPDGRSAQVILGADDKHLVFRSCVAVTCGNDGSTEFALSTRVACKNRFGRFYMALISLTHRKYVAPMMLAFAVDAVLGG